MNHHTLLTAPRQLSASAAPFIVQRSDEDFIDSMLAELKAAAGLPAAAQARTDAGVLKLFQPIQRQFHLALVEAWCDTPGTPRLNPGSLLSAGLVIRRLDAQGAAQGWMKSEGRPRGWVPLQRLGGDNRDPLAAERKRLGATGVKDLDAQLQRLQLALPESVMDEAVVPLYPAPPELCQALAKTLLYAVLPTTSSELVESASGSGIGTDAATGGGTGSANGGLDFSAHSTAFVGHLVEGLRGQAMALPMAGETLVAAWADEAEVPSTQRPATISLRQWQDLNHPSGETRRRLDRLLLLLRQLGAEFNAFDGGAEAQPLRDALAAIQLPLVLRPNEARRQVSALAFLATASRVLLSKLASDAAHNATEVPEQWPALSSDQSLRLQRALHSALQARFAASQTHSSRFEEPGARYQVRAFMRVQRECGTELVWSAPSEPFVIAEWWEGAGAPPVQIRLPDASNKKLLRALKPNVSFVVPPALQNMLSAKSADLLKGNTSINGPGLSWVCSFSIPIITICAFLVLNIFLSLLNLVFGWLFFVKICLPLPKLGIKPPGSES